MKNPFRSAGNRPPEQSQQLQSVNPSRWLALRGILLGTILLCATAFLSIDLWTWRQIANRQTDALRQTSHARARLSDQTRSLRAERDQARGALDRSQTEQKRLTARLSSLEQEQQKASEAQRRLENEMRLALASRDVTISELAGKLTVNILDRVLFASGEAEITEEGRQVLRQVASILDRFPNRQIQVIGHTDNIPINTPQYPSNWELSAARALAAVRYLSEEAGVDPARLGALAHGEFHPVADNTTPEGRAQNRRIAIVVLPEIVTQEDPFPASENGGPTIPSSDTDAMPEL